MNRERDLAFFTVGFGQVTQLVPIFFALPKFLSGAIQLGGLMQIRIAFQQVASAIGWASRFLKTSASGPSPAVSPS